MPAGYKFRGVPKVFKTREQALSFLRNSPGYRAHQWEYLTKYYPGLASEFAGAIERPILIGRAQKLGTMPRRPGISDAVVAVAKDVGHTIAGDIRSTLGAAQSGGGPVNRTIDVPVSVQKAGNVGGPTARRTRKVGSGLADATLGKGIPNLIQGQGPKSAQDVLGIGLGAAMVLPVGRIGKGAYDVGKAARGIEEAAPAVARATRTLKVNEKVQQFPRARSAVTQKALERPADAISQAMEADNRIAKIARAVFPTAPATARVAKQAGYHQAWEASRAWGPLRQHARALPKEGSPEDVAHFWWAQLPVRMRNAAGLKLVRAKQAENLDYYASGKALDDLQADLARVKDEIRAWDGETRPNDLLREQESIRIQIADIPSLMDDLSQSVARLDKVIAKPPKLDPKIVRAIDEFDRERTAILVKAGVLDPEDAVARRGLVSNWLGVADPRGSFQEGSASGASALTRFIDGKMFSDSAAREFATEVKPPAVRPGDEIYVGHRGPRVRGSRQSLLPGAMGGGKPRTPEGVGTQNRLVRASTGRVRDSTSVAVDDWQSAQVWRSALSSRDDLGKMGRRFDGHLREGEMLINPKGRLVPGSWKSDRLEQIANQGYDETEIRDAAREIVDGFMASDPESVARMLDEARAAGVQWDELRVLDKKTAERYFKQFTAAPRSGPAGRAYDTAVDLAVASIVFARIGYVPKNIAANLILSVPHQGVYMFANVPRAMQVLTDPELFGRLAAEVGESGPTAALATEAGVKKVAGSASRFPGKVAGVFTGVADTPLRISAFLHEAAAEGVIKKLSPVLDDADRMALIALTDNPANRELLNDIRSRSVEAMADFSRLNPTQRKWARRFLVIPGWLWAGSRYPVHFAATHPGRAAAIGYIAAGEPGAPFEGNKPITEYMAEGVPEWAQGIATGDGKVLRTGSISPVSTPWELGLAAAQRDGRTVGDYTNPLAAAAYNMAQSQLDGPNGPYRTSYQESVAGNLRRLVPNYALAKGLISPSESKYYPEDKARLGRLKREVGVVPIEISKTQKKKNRQRSGSTEGAYRRLTTGGTSGAYKRLMLGGR